MEIKRTQKEEQTSLISVKVGEKDYGEAVEKSLRDYRRKANIPGFRPGKPTSDFITKALGKVTFVGALFLAVVALLPLIVGAVNSSLRNVALGGTSVIIVVGVALDTVKQMEAQMLMRHHKGFLE